ncbi:hypothetical protein L6452_08479 [Arctium lappa]|uniref:Uncharacterized protein n=1 Tax=Arctium lappa TaxID=4217 RepID=A0ACB9DHT8_ARCLA|nr:hypothetical protein L6452_08479 [Arctium lappa]
MLYVVIGLATFFGCCNNLLQPTIVRLRKSWSCELVNIVFGVCTSYKQRTIGLSTLVIFILKVSFKNDKTNH